MALPSSITNEGTCLAYSGSWTAGSCSDKTYTDETACKTPRATWIPGFYLDLGYYGSFWIPGSCSDTTYTDKTACEAPRGTWKPGSCSGVTSPWRLGTATDYPGLCINSKLHRPKLNGTNAPTEVEILSSCPTN